MDLNVIKSGTWGTCLWGIDDTGFLLIGEGTGASINREEDAPWHEMRSIITEVKFVGNVNMPEESGLRAAFKNCRLLSNVDATSLDTYQVADMGSMFENCESLTELSLTSFDTSNVVNMNRMFYGCKQLSNLDLSSFSTVETLDMHEMFSKCNKLHNITLGDRFSTVGSGKTSCGNLAIRDTGRYRMAKVVDVIAGSITYHSNTVDDRILTRQSITGFRYMVEDNKFPIPRQQCRFNGWSTEPNGKGTVYQPGEEIENLEEDLDLYAIWVAPPLIGTLEQPSEISYGMPLKFEMPDIMTETDDPVTGYIEISPKGKERTWKQIEYNAVLPVSYDGYMMRLVAYNDYGISYSNPVMIRIRKAKLDLSRIYWAENSDMTYDGTQKGVWLEGLPEGVKAVYEGNCATDAGIYTTVATLDYDKNNFDTNLKLKPHRWEIKKAKYNMSNARWNYEDAFVFNNAAHTILLSGLPDGVEAIYKDNTATEVGVRTAFASFEYDATNYEKPDDVAPCVWEIKKAYIDTANLKWTDCSDFVYDGERRSVVITNLPEGAEVTYYGNEEYQAGKYLARATLSNNFYTHGPIEYEWSINKAKHNMKAVHWSYNHPLVYDRTTHEVGLVNVPSGLEVRYYNHIGMDAGDYYATAAFVCRDSHNFETPADMNLTWTIKKAAADMSNVSWDYSVPFTYDGGVKTVELVGLPSEVYAVIENGSATRAGVYVAHAVLKYDENNYEVEQPSDCQWQINKAKFDVSDVHWNYSNPFMYNGEEKIINLVNVPEGINVEYQNNVKLEAGKYVATARLTPSDIVNYEIPVVNACTWSINKSALDKVDIFWSDDRDFVFDGTTKSVRIISELNEMIRVEYSGADEVNAGEHEAVATFFSVDPNNYEAPTPVHHRWSIQKNHFNISGVVWDYTSRFTYDGSKKEVKLLNVPEGLVVNYENNDAVEVGEYTAIARFEIMDSDNYYPLEPIELHWAIQKATYDMSAVRWQNETVFAYDEAVKTVELVGLPQGITPNYSNNFASEAGEYLASVEFNYDEHNYEMPSFCDCVWKIEKSTFTIENVMWDYEEPFIYDGSEKTVRLINLPEGSTVKYNNVSATDHGIYTASADVYSVDNENYTIAHMPELVWRIDKGEYDMDQAYWDYDKAYDYDGTQKTVVIKGLPEGVTANYHGNIGVDAGVYNASAVFHIADYANYNVPTFENCEWTINKIDYDMTGVEWNCKSALLYDGRMKEVALLGLPNGVRAICDGNYATSVGKYTATAEFQIADPVNYKVPSFPSCNWEIKKADFDMSRVTWSADTSREYNGRTQSIFLENLPNGVNVEYAGNEATEVGKYTASAILTVVDEDSFNTPSINNCEWEIRKADIDMSGVTWDFVEDSFTYDGNPKTVGVRNLPEYVTAALAGNTATSAGRYTATAEFAVTSPNYNAPETIALEWYINRATIDMSGVKWDYNEEFIYDGMLHGVEVTGLPSNVTVSYENNRKSEVGEYIAVANFHTDITNHITPEPQYCQWIINKAKCDISSIRWDYDQAFTYDGTAKQLKLSGVPSMLNVKYYGNEEINAGRYTARAEFTAIDENTYDAPAPLEFEWEIGKASYDMGQTLWCNDRLFVYNGATKAVVVEGYPEGIRPVYENNTAIEAGRYHAEVRFEYDYENYNEPRMAGCDWNIIKNTYDMSNVYWDYSRPLVYNGNEQSVILKGLPAGVEAVYYNNSAVEAGEYEARVSFVYDEENYEKPTFGSCVWVIDKANIPVNLNEVTWDYITPFTYTGAAYTVELRKVVDEQSFFGRLRGDKKLEHISGIPAGFDVIYEDNMMTEVGSYYARATVVPADNDNYKPYEIPALRWEIKKAVIDMSEVCWNYGGNFVYDGSVKCVELDGVPGMIDVKYLNNEAINAGTYEAQAIFELKDERNYEKPRAFRGCMWTIDKAPVDVSGAGWDYYDAIVYDGSEKKVYVTGLPEGVSVVGYRGNTATEAGNYTAEVILTCEDSHNYEAPRIAPLKWRVQRQRINLDSVMWNYDEGSLFVYDEQIKEVELVGMPSDIEVIYVNNRRINAGTYVAKARLVYDNKNYIADEIPDLVWKIEKASFDTSMTYWEYDGPYIFDGHEKRVLLRNVPNHIDVRYMDNRATSIGSYTAKAYLSYNTDNYNDPNIDRTIEWEIVR